MNQSPYQEEILRSSRRLLTLMDRNPFGPSSGSFSRNFWHFKTSDFPSATDQMGIAILAKLYCLQGSEYYRNAYILNLVKLGISNLKQIQKDDGSFDEWYVNERGWAGPTGYIMNAALDTFEDVSSFLDADSKTVLEEVIRKGISFLTRSQEGHVLANHLAIVVLPLIQAKHILGMPELEADIQNLLVDFKKEWIEEEGWSVEYDGADPGYQTATLSFFAKTLKYERRPEILKICEKSLEFIQYFAFPSGVFGGSIGSRHTVNIFCAGVEAFRDHPLGARLSNFLKEGFEKGTQVLGSDLDDHYMIYRLYELLDAHRYFITTHIHSSPNELPWEKGPFRMSFLKAGFEIGKTRNSYWVIALKRGGAFRIEDAFNKSVLRVDSGILVAAGNKKFTSLWQGAYTIDQSMLKVSGSLVDVTPKLFSPIKQIIFRTFCLMTGFHHVPSLWTKNLIRKILMVNNIPSAWNFSRSFLITEKTFEIKTSLSGKGQLDKVLIGGEFWTRYVPQSRHFLAEHLKLASPQFFTSSPDLPLDFEDKVELK